MKVGVVLFGDEVCPRFGYATQLLLATVEGGQVRDREVTALSDRNAQDHPRYLASLGVQTLICGGVHQAFLHDLRAEGIDVIWGVIGPATDALVMMSQGTLRPDQFVCRRERHGQGPRARGTNRRLATTAASTKSGRRRRNGGWSPNESVN